MTTTNLFGPSVGRGHVRGWAIAGLRLWMPDYLREAERSQGYPVGRAQPPRSYPSAPDLRKMPEQALPAIVVQLPGLSERGTRRGASGEYGADWLIALSAVVHGRDFDDTEALADVYGLALRMLMLQQAGGFIDSVAYTGPNLVIEGIEYGDESYDDLPWSRSRTLVAATVTFRIEVRGVASAAFGPLEPSDDPLQDPGADPEVTTTAITYQRRA